MPAWSTLDRGGLFLAAGRDGHGTGWRRVRDDARFRRLSLVGLSDGEVDNLAQARGVGLTTAGARRLRRHTGGNPRHICALMEEVGARELGRSEARLPAPRAVCDDVWTRMESCSERGRALLEALAVLGGPSTLSVAGAVAGVEDPWGALEDARRSGLISDSPGSPASGVRLRDALVAAAIYDRLDGPARHELHQRAAGCLLGGDGFAHRLPLAVLEGEGGALLVELESTAERAGAQGDHELAARTWRMAAGLQTDPARRRRLLVLGADESIACGDAAGAEECVADLDDETGGWVALLSGEAALLEGHSSLARRRLQAAWAAAGSGESAIKARAAAGLAFSR